MYLFENLVSQAVEKAKDKKTRVAQRCARQWKKLKTRKRAQSGAVPGSGKSERQENARSPVPCQAVEKAKDKKTRVVRPHAGQWKKREARKRAQSGPVPGSGKS